MLLLVLGVACVLWLIECRCCWWWLLLLVVCCVSLLVMVVVSGLWFVVFVCGLSLFVVDGVCFSCVSYV